MNPRDTRIDNGNADFPGPISPEEQGHMEFERVSALEWRPTTPRVGSFSIYFTDGGYTEFPSGGAQAEQVVVWFRNADDGQVITLRTETGITVHAQKRNISRIVVSES